MALGSIPRFYVFLLTDTTRMAPSTTILQCRLGYVSSRKTLKIGDFLFGSLETTVRPVLTQRRIFVSQVPVRPHAAERPRWTPVVGAFAVRRGEDGRRDLSDIRFALQNVHRN